MTTDFLITLQGTHRPMVVARTVKPTSELNKRRVQEKFEIERRYWLKRGIDWGIVTEQDIDTTLAQNLQLLRQYWDVSNRLNGNSERLAEIVKELNLIASNNSDQSLRTMTRLCGQRLNLPAGDCLAVIYHLLITRQWQANLRMPLNPTKPITSLETKENKDA